MPLFQLTTLLVLAALAISSVTAHGYPTEPMMRGTTPNGEVDYCPHCCNSGGVGSVSAGGPFKEFDPFNIQRHGIGICGDRTGSNDHMRAGKFATPVSDYTKISPGVANFGYSFNTNHQGYLSFYLCDVSSTGDVQNSPDFFNAHCKQLDRSPVESCEAGTDAECGPIDPKYPGRWVIPPQVSAVSGEKMAYKIPAGNYADAVVITYWRTVNSCNTGDNFMQDYAYPSAWGSIPGDGGTAGGKPMHASDCVAQGRTPEEFFSCSDVTMGGAGPGAASAAPAAADAGANAGTSENTRGGSNDRDNNNDHSDKAPEPHNKGGNGGKKRRNNRSKSHEHQNNGNKSAEHKTNCS